MNTNKADAMKHFLADMREVDEEMANGGAHYDVDELKRALDLIPIDKSARTDV